MKKPIFSSKLLYKNYLTDDLLVIGFEVGSEFNFKAGQFFHIITDKDNPDDEKIGFRSYSILNSPTDSKSIGVIESFVKLIPGGLGSEFIKKLNIGDDVFLRGAFGKFYLDNSNSDHVFLCTGTGITPINSIITEHLNSNNTLTLFYSAKTKSELLNHDIFVDLEKRFENFKYYPTLTREDDSTWSGLTGRIPAHLGILNDISSKTFYMCGQKDFIIDVLPLLKGKAKNIIIERYD